MKKAILLVFMAYVISLSLIYTNSERKTISNIDIINERDVTVCIVDNFKDKVLNGYSHGEIVRAILEEDFNGEIIEVEVTTSFYKDDFNHSACDVINYSQVISEENRNHIVDFRIAKFATAYEGILVVASGNKGETNTQSEWSHLRKTNSKFEVLDRTLIVGQMVKDEKSSKGYLTSSFGKEIDYVVDNGDKVLLGVDLFGSSYAAPVVAGKVANLLSKGYSFESAKEMVKSDNVFNDGQGYRYNILKK